MVRSLWGLALVAMLALAACAPNGAPLVPSPSGARAPVATPVVLSTGTAGEWAGAGGATSATATRGMPPVVATAGGSPGGSAPGCDPAGVARTVTAFMAAFNAGDQARLADFFAPLGSDGADGVRDPGNPDQFQHYSVTEVLERITGTPPPPWRHFVARNRAAALAYFAARHAQGERLELLMLGVAPGVATTPTVVDISYVLRRVAADLPPVLGGPGRLANGKGVINCRRGQITVWSMGMGPLVAGEEASYLAQVRPCPAPPTPTGAAPGPLVCLRR